MKRQWAAIAHQQLTIAPTQRTHVIMTAITTALLPSLTITLLNISSITSTIITIAIYHYNLFASALPLPTVATYYHALAGNC
jgi:hypothetical protein